MRWSYACYGKANSFAQMNCPWGTRVSLRRIAFGSKADPSCPLETEFFTPLSCCIPECGDCLVEDLGFRQHIIQQSSCDGQPRCSVRAQRAPMSNCGTKPFSNYMVIMYECIPDSDILADHLQMFTPSVEEELCASQTFNRPYENWRNTQGVGGKHNITSSPLPPHTPTPNPAGINGSTTLPGGVAPNLAREGAIIGALVGGATLLIAVVLFIVICCCIRWRSDEEEEDAENKSNLSFMDPVTMQPSYHAFGSVDGSSMAEQVQSDNLSVWSVSTDQYSPAKLNQPTLGRPEEHVTSCQGGWYENERVTHDGFAPCRPVPVPRSSRPQQARGIEAKRQSQAKKCSRKSWNISIISRKDRGMRKSKNRSSKSRDRTTKADPNTAASCKRRAKDNYYKGKALALKELTLPHHNSQLPPDCPGAVGPPTNNRGISSWWLFNAMRTGSEPITRFQHHGQHFGRTAHRRK